MSTPGSSEPMEAVDLMDTNDPAAISHDQDMASSPTTNGTDGPKLTMGDSSISETLPGDEEGPPPPPPPPIPYPPEEQSLKSAPEEPQSSPTSVGSDKMVVGKDDIEASNNSNNNSNNSNDKDGIVKPKKQELKKTPEINPRYKDVQETGQWGDLSSREFYIAIGAFLLVIVVVVLVVLFVVILPGNDDENNVIVPAPTNAPSTPIPPNEELALVLSAIEKSPFTASLLDDTTQLPNDPTFYEGLMDNESSTSQQKAIDWLLFQDQFKDPDYSVFRFALAAIYFGMGGPNWASSEGWLTSVHMCEWENISCDTRNVFQELDLSEQDLTGTLPSDIALLGETGIRSILMSRNNISGPIPGGVLASLPNLGILYLDNNMLTGTVPVELVADARLRKCRSSI
jgi:hypothetical protein